jgi:hypothetical protein
MKNALLKLALDSSMNTAALAADSAYEVVPGVTDYVITEAAEKGVAIGAKVREVMSNKYVLSGLAAVAVVGAAYGTYRLIKNSSDTKAVAKAAAVAPVAPLSAEAKVDHAREMLEQAQAELKAAKKVLTAA